VSEETVAKGYFGAHNRQTQFCLLHITKCTFRPPKRFLTGMCPPLPMPIPRNTVVERQKVAHFVHFFVLAQSRRQFMQVATKAKCHQALMLTNLLIFRTLTM